MRWREWTALGPGYGGAFDGKTVPCELEGPPEDFEMWCPNIKDRVRETGTRETAAV